MPSAQVQQALIILTFRRRYDLFGCVFEYVTETFCEVLFFCNPTLIRETYDFNFNLSLLELGSNKKIERLVVCRLFVSDKRLLGSLVVWLIIHRGC